MTETRNPADELPLAAHLLEIVIALGEGPAHGYGIITQIERQTNGAVKLSTSSLYAALRTLQRRGLVGEAAAGSRASAGPPRKYFQVTDFGRRVARLEVQRLKDVATRAERGLLGPAAAGSSDA